MVTKTATVVRHAYDLSICLHSAVTS